MKHNYRIVFFVLLISLIGFVKGYSNPILPGYFADPTIKEFGNTYYIYATADGIKLASGEPTVWVSFDLVNWFNYEMDMDLPEGLTNCWAPDVVEGKDGKYYYYMGNCQFGCNIYGYVSDTPVGPWIPINDGKPVIPVGTGKKSLPALDAQFFVDDDGSLYAYFGTWCTSFGGMGWVKISSDDMFTIENQGFIPISQIPKVFEAAYMMKRNGKYILMYSAGDCKRSSYAVHYAWSDSPKGPFNYGQNNPVLSSNDDGSVDGPGHHSVLEYGNDYYLFYHRHDNPHSTGGMFRQVCVDKLEFLNDTTIDKIIPTHNGVVSIGKEDNLLNNLAKNKNAEATSYYHLKVKPSVYSSNNPVDYKYHPSNAVDDSNNTIWKASSSQLPQSITIDLGKVKPFNRILTEFEYPTYFYQYYIETSSDGLNWEIFTDKRTNKASGSPMIDERNTKARYVKITITAIEKSGLFGAIWNVKVVNQSFDFPDYLFPKSEGEVAPLYTEELVVDIDFSQFKEGDFEDDMINKGVLGGIFIKRGSPVIKSVDGFKGLYLDGKSYLELKEKPSGSMQWNAPYTAAAWVYNPEIGHGECIAGWTSRRDMLQASYTAMYYGTGNYGAVAHGDWAVDLPFMTIPDAGKWHHIVVTFDGMLENIYVDGILNNQAQMMLFVKSDNILIGTSGISEENYSGYIANFRLYNKPLNQNEVTNLMEATMPDKIQTD